MRNHLTVSTLFVRGQTREGELAASATKQVSGIAGSLSPDLFPGSLEAPLRESTGSSKSWADLGLNPDSLAGLPWASYYAFLKFTCL